MHFYQFCAGVIDVCQGWGDGDVVSATGVGDY